MGLCVPSPTSSSGDSAGKKRRTSSLSVASVLPRRQSLTAAADAIKATPQKVAQGTSKFLDDVLAGADEFLGGSAPRAIKAGSIMTDEEKTAQKDKLYKMVNERRLSRLGGPEA